MLDTEKQKKRIPGSTFTDVVHYTPRFSTRSQRHIFADAPAQIATIPTSKVAAEESRRAVVSALLHAARTWRPWMLFSIAFMGRHQFSPALIPPWTPLTITQMLLFNRQWVEPIVMFETIWVSLSASSMARHPASLQTWSLNVLGSLLAASVPCVNDDFAGVNHSEGHVLSGTHNEIDIRHACLTTNAYIRTQQTEDIRELVVTELHKRKFVSLTLVLFIVPDLSLFKVADGDPGLAHRLLVPSPAAAVYKEPMVRHLSRISTSLPARPDDMSAFVLLSTGAHAVHATHDRLHVMSSPRPRFLVRMIGTRKSHPFHMLSRQDVGNTNPDWQVENNSIRPAKSGTQPQNLAKLMNDSRKSESIHAMPKKDPDKCSSETTEPFGDTSTQLRVIPSARDVQPVVNINIYEQNNLSYVFDAATSSVASPLFRPYVSPHLFVVLLAFSMYAFFWLSCHRVLPSFCILWAIKPLSTVAPPPPPRPEPLPYPTGPYQSGVASARAPAPPPRPDPQPYPTGPYQSGVGTALASR